MQATAEATAYAAIAEPVVNETMVTVTTPPEFEVTVALKAEAPAPTVVEAL
jgi:hypothetical protein